MANLNSITPQQLGDRFAEILRTWLTPAEWEEMQARNAGERGDLCCHSHDFCDANMAMIEAWEAFDLPEADPGSEDHVGLMNAAWNHAATTHFGRPA